MIGIEKSGRIFIYALPIDGRLAHRGLADLVTNSMKRDLLQGDISLFISGSRRAAKIIIFDGTALLLMHKKLEKGLFMQVPHSTHGSELSGNALEKILNGSNVLLGYSLENS